MIISKAASVNAAASEEVSFPLSREGREIFIGEGRQMREVWETVKKSSSSDAAVLITGETGTGKELIAESIHLLSPRKDNAIVKVNCAALPETLLESELFGYEKGAFTGAASAKPGRFELAHKGTIFLDEIGDISHVTQVKLLRVLQEKEFERLGGTETKKVDIRIISATNRILLDEIKNGKFREELYYRLNIIPIQLPPLRERQDDIPHLVDYFFRKICKEYEKKPPSIADDAITALKTFSWPGNIRQLENIIERIIVLNESEKITGDHIRKHFETKVSETVRDETESLEEVIKKEAARIEKDIILKALDRSGGNITRAAEELKISRKTLHNKIKQYAIDR
ncbi:Regulatory protein AtoC [subsurface metagenome]